MKFDWKALLLPILLQVVQTATQVVTKVVEDKTPVTHRTAGHFQDGEICVECGRSTAAPVSPPNGGEQLSSTHDPTVHADVNPSDMSRR